VALRHRLGWEPQFIQKSIWLWPLAAAAEPLGATRTHWPSHAELDALYARRAVEQRQAPGLHFSPDRGAMQHRRDHEAARIDAAQLYDGRIAVDRIVHTRAENWHDLLNALCFATWPKSKLALHERQYRALCRRLAGDARRLPTTRTREQDALTIFDEGGVVIAAKVDVADTLSRAPARAVEPVVRGLVEAGEAIVVVPFGHALFEHMVEGLPCPRASARVIVLTDIPGQSMRLLDAIDDALACQLADPSQFCTPREGKDLRLQSLSPERTAVQGSA
jgi:hypothetical protein